ncbi:UDP-N-acetylmuramoyl-L-alanine--D-glutamate ligase [Candidatus Zixiibacteriota bacterium]
MDIAGSRVVIIGLGISGRSVAGLLARRGARVLVSDTASRSDLQEDLAELENMGVEIETGGHSRTLLDGADLVVLSPGVDPASGPAEEALDRGMKVVSEIEAASWFFDGPVIGITGSNGKSTTTALTTDMLLAGGISAVAGGNLGRAFSSIVSEEPEAEVIVLELSSFQLEKVERFRAETGVLLNISPDHLDRHPTAESYEAAKARLWKGQRRGDWAIYSADDDGATRLAGLAPGERLSFTVDGRPEGPGAWIDDHGGAAQAVALLPGSTEREPLFALDDLHLPGTHNLSNALAAALTARRYGVRRNAISEALRAFRALPHRLEPVGDIDGVRFFNDSKATNVASALSALSGFTSGVVLLAGGKYKGIPFTPLREELMRCGTAAVLIGESRPWLQKDLEGTVPLHEAGSLEEAVTIAWRLAGADGVVLLAPACSSFDMFSNYEERGDRFREAVIQLREEVLARA